MTGVIKNSNCDTKTTTSEELDLKARDDEYISRFHWRRKALGFSKRWVKEFEYIILAAYISKKTTTKLLAEITSLQYRMFFA